MSERKKGWTVKAARQAPATFLKVIQDHLVYTEDGHLHWLGKFKLVNNKHLYPYYSKVNIKAFLKWYTDGYGLEQNIQPKRSCLDEGCILPEHQAVARSRPAPNGLGRHELGPRKSASPQPKAVFDLGYPKSKPTTDVREALGEFIGNVEWAAQAIKPGGLDHEAATRKLEELLASLGYVRIDPEDEAQVETGARSICLAEYRDPDEIGPFGVSDYGERWRGYTARARAVLSALRGGA